MNCSEFQTIVSEIVSISPPASALHREAQMHAHDCLPCNNRLEQARSLQRGLQNLAAETAAIPNAAQLKKSVLASFQEQQFALAQTTATHRQWSWRWSLAGSALVVMLFGTGWYFFSATPSVSINEQAQTSAPQFNEQKIPASVTKTVSAEKINVPFASPAAPARSAAKLSAPDSVRRGNARRNMPAATTRDSIAQEVETTSEYIPLTYAADERALQNGVVVRLEVPRETLLAMGVPLNVETKDTTIKADVVMGDNGVAYAYRLVR